MPVLRCPARTNALWISRVLAILALRDDATVRAYSSRTDRGSTKSTLRGRRNAAAVRPPARRIGPTPHFAANKKSFLQDRIVHKPSTTRHSSFLRKEMRNKAATCSDTGACREKRDTLWMYSHGVCESLHQEEAGSRCEQAERANGRMKYLPHDVFIPYFSMGRVCKETESDTCAPAWIQNTSGLPQSKKKFDQASVSKINQMFDALTQHCAANESGHQSQEYRDYELRAVRAGCQESGLHSTTTTTTTARNCVGEWSATLDELRTSCTGNGERLTRTYTQTVVATWNGLHCDFDDGHTESITCPLHRCKCAHGQPETGGGCSADGNTHGCEEDKCHSGYHSTSSAALPNKFTCAVNECTCPQGTSATGPDCAPDGTTVGCQTCATAGYHLSAAHDGGLDECILARCRCPHGVPAEGVGCDIDETVEKCTACSARGYHLSDAFRCEQNMCTCYNGTPATGAACEADGTEMCHSCDTGYRKGEDGKCGWDNTCTCVNGVPVPGATGTCEVNGVRICSGCEIGYHKDEHGACVENVCACEPGTPLTGARCVFDGVSRGCTACGAGYTLVGTTCQATTASSTTTTKSGTDVVSNDESSSKIPGEAATHGTEQGTGNSANNAASASPATTNRSLESTPTQRALREAHNSSPVPGTDILGASGGEETVGEKDATSGSGNNASALLTAAFIFGFMLAVAGCAVMFCVGRCKRSNGEEDDELVVPPKVVPTTTPPPNPPATSPLGRPRRSFFLPGSQLGGAGDRSSQVGGAAAAVPAQQESTSSRAGPGKTSKAAQIEPEGASSKKKFGMNKEEILKPAKEQEMKLPKEEVKPPKEEKSLREEKSKEKKEQQQLKKDASIVAESAGKKAAVASLRADSGGGASDGDLAAFGDLVSATLAKQTSPSGKQQDGSADSVTTYPSHDSTDNPKSKVTSSGDVKVTLSKSTNGGIFSFG
ncbi:unnamed protein product [Amoebophrya sp. A120]|nr:unnamed protein product [Amoebophrya sp. A120]|eukprot:GSA120T00016598001.1